MIEGDEMKCPYAFDRIIKTETEIKYDDEGQEQGSNVTTYNKGIFANCQTTNCGAWYNGRCHYHEPNYE